MTYRYKTNTYGDNRDKEVIINDEQILNSYWEPWSQLMILMGKHEKVNELNCINDWVKITNAERIDLWVLEVELKPAIAYKISSDKIVDTQFGVYSKGDFNAVHVDNYDELLVYLNAIGARVRVDDKPELFFSRPGFSRVDKLTPTYFHLDLFL